MQYTIVSKNKLTLSKNIFQKEKPDNLQCDYQAFIFVCYAI